SLGWSMNRGNEKRGDGEKGKVGLFSLRFTTSPVLRCILGLIPAIRVANFVWNLLFVIYLFFVI
ncbi:hypothetical protein JW948_01900, partial [bacterium]|nr:hypothetical protein [bacterium]